jgi:hypothetical protein
MQYKITQNGNFINIIEAPLPFIDAYCHTMNYEYEEIILPEPTSVKSNPTPEEQIKSLQDALTANQLQNDTAIAELSMLISSLATPTAT